jgi:enoyl-CoA hydratase/carnithine racemase
VEHETILEDRRDNGVISVTLDRPDTLNAINVTMHHELRGVFQRARLDRGALHGCLCATRAVRRSGRLPEDPDPVATQSEDYREGIRALVEKREARFSGR